MKKVILFFVIATCISGSLFGQSYAVDKGATIASGMASFSYSGGKLYESTDGKGLTTISLSPAVNYLVIPNFFIGGSLGLTYQTRGDNSSTSLGIGPQLGYFIGNSESTAFPYLTAGFRYNIISLTGYETANGSDILLGFGVLVPMKGNIGFTIECGYHIMSVTYSGESRSGNIISLGIGFSGLFY